MPRELLQTLFDIVLKCNVFSFSTHTFQQTQGTAMGTKMAPSYVNHFMRNLKAIRSRQEVGVVLRNAVNMFMLISEYCYGDEGF